MEYRPLKIHLAVALALLMLPVLSCATSRQLSANGFAALMHFTLADVINAEYLTAADSLEYIKAWSQPGALTGGLNYSRAARTGSRHMCPGSPSSEFPTQHTG